MLYKININMNELTSAIELLKNLIITPSFSREEAQTAELIANYFNHRGITPHRKGNNIWVSNLYFDPGKKTILLNSHHDTVKPASGWTYDPFEATLEGDRLTGLGSNDAGGPLVSLLATFLHFYAQKNLPVNLIYAATAEEEISGTNGIASILGDLGEISLGIVGEPTQMQMAIAEKGLMVLDGTSMGRSGHAARQEGINALYIAVEDINWIRTYNFDKVSALLGDVKMSVTQIAAGSQHNVVPDTCKFVVDVRTNECYSNQEVYDIIDASTRSRIEARSFRLNSSRISPDHLLIQAGKTLNFSTFGSPTLSDQALMPFETLKMGPGDSARSHTPDEYIYLGEIEEGVRSYIDILETYFRSI